MENINKDECIYVAFENGKLTELEQNKKVIFVYDEKLALIFEYYLLKAVNDDKY